MARYIPPITRQLSQGDKEYIKRIEAGERKAPAFRASYPEHPAVVMYTRSEPGSPDRTRAVELVIAAAKNKLQAKYLHKALVTYHDRMEEFSDASLDTAIELVKGARSEKVRADLAIEGVRQKIGTPVTKVAIQEKKTVYLTFGSDPSEKKEIIEGETVERDVLDESDYS